MTGLTERKKHLLFYFDSTARKIYEIDLPPAPDFYMELAQCRA